MRASRSREQDGRAEHVLRKHTTIGFHDSHRIAILTVACWQEPLLVKVPELLEK